MHRTETEPPTLEDAIALAAQAHRGQIYPSLAGEPYILHPLRVMLRLDTTTERIVAALHDVVEDTAYTLDGLRRLGYPDEVIDALDRLTRRAEETYEDYIRRLQDHPLARRVKLADLAENLANNRQQEPDAERVARIARYRWAQATLLAAADPVGGV
jgi:(p)ppGpp synthase/HD superfamily hydrolase